MNPIKEEVLKIADRGVAHRQQNQTAIGENGNPPGNDRGGIVIFGRPEIFDQLPLGWIGVAMLRRVIGRVSRPNPGQQHHDHAGDQKCARPIEPVDQSSEDLVSAGNPQKRRPRDHLRGGALRGNRLATTPAQGIRGRRKEST